MKIVNNSSCLVLLYYNCCFGGYVFVVLMPTCALLLFCFCYCCSCVFFVIVLFIYLFLLLLLCILIAVQFIAYIYGVCHFCLLSFIFFSFCVSCFNASVAFFLMLQYYFSPFVSGCCLNRHCLRCILLFFCHSAVYCSHLYCFY